MTKHTLYSTCLPARMWNIKHFSQNTAFFMYNVIWITISENTCVVWYCLCFYHIWKTNWFSLQRKCCWYSGKNHNFYFLTSQDHFNLCVVMCHLIYLLHGFNKSGIVKVRMNLKVGVKVNIRRVDKYRQRPCRSLEKLLKAP